MKIAVLMPYLNSESTIKESVKSVCSQTYGNLELIAVDNGSSDGSAKIVGEICGVKTKCIHLFCPEKGIVPALNTGLFYILSRQGSEKFDAVARIDSDDVWLCDKLEKQVAFLSENPEVSILGTQIDIFGDEFEGTLSCEYPLKDEEIKKTLFERRNAFAHPSVVVLTSVFYRCGVYDDIYRHCEDYQYWMKASKHFKFANLPDVLLRYRLKKNPNYNPVIPFMCKMKYGQAIIESQS